MDIESATVSQLLEALAQKIHELEQASGALTDTIREQVSAVEDLAAAADAAAAAIKSGGFGDPNNNPWDLPTKIAGSTVRQQDTTARYAQAAIDSGSTSNMQNAMDSLMDRMESLTKNIILPAEEQYALAQQQGNTAKAQSIRYNINDSQQELENIQMQIDRIKSAISGKGGTVEKTYRLEIQSATGKKSYIETGDDSLQALLTALGNYARLV
jgi:hypothetical protein